ncbi:MAG: prolipoprotein diacylglyceryl transferase, partial [Anaerolineaceae bacterium]|nr:prolipoprotein diacylglyceryl transferase [Anaerolineaceae bacterium]
MNSFSFWVGIGAALGLWRIARSSPQPYSTTLVNMGLFTLLCSLFGARLFYTWINYEYFSAHLIEIPQIWLGGLSWPGAVGGAWIAILSLPLTHHDSHGSRIPLGWIADRIYPLLPPLSISIWLGCWSMGVAYGPALAEGTWWAIPSLDESGTFNLHWPLQFLSALSLLVFFLLLELRLKRPRPTGLLAGLAAAGLLVHLFAASLLRADPDRFWGGIRADTWMATAYLALFFIMILFRMLVP